MGSNNKSKLSLGVLLGFSDELQKIAMSPIGPSTVGEVTKVVSRKGTSLSTKQPKYSKVPKDLTPPASPVDFAQSSKAVQPPPVTMLRGD